MIKIFCTTLIIIISIISILGLLTYLFFIVKNPKKDYEKDIPIIKNWYKPIDNDNDSLKDNLKK